MCSPHSFTPLPDLSLPTKVSLTQYFFLQISRIYQHAIAHQSAAASSPWTCSTGLSRKAWSPWLIMAELGNEHPAVNPSQDGSQEVGERMGSLQTQFSELATLVSSQPDLLKSFVEMQQGKEVESSGDERVAPRDTGLQASAHQSGAAGGAAGSMGGDAKGFGVSIMRVGSRSVSSGLNPHVSAENGFSVPAVNFGFTQGTVGRADIDSQSAVPPAPSLSSEWWENVAGGNTLIPGADTTDTGEKMSRGPLKVPKSPVFDDRDVSYPSWSQNVLLSARHNNLYEAFVSDIKIPITNIVFDLTLWIEKVFNVGVVRQAEIAWWFRFDRMKKDSLKPWLGTLVPPA